jgi:glycosyltransferase involved in cell wall biosynthesis
MKIMGYMAAWNEAEYVEYAIRSVIDHVDVMLVIEGAFKETVDAGGSHRSDDGTLEILERLRDEFGNLHVFQAPVYGQLQHRQLSLNFMTPQDYWLWLVDADEVYDPADAVKLKAVLGSTKADVIKVNSFTFVNDFRHYAGIAFPRCFRILEEREYVFSGPNHLLSRRRDGGYGCPWYIPSPQDTETHEKDIKFFHYSYCKSSERFLMKKKERENVHGTFKWKLDEDDNVVSPGVNIRIFNGQHPEIMRTHPKWNSKI